MPKMHIRVHEAKAYDFRPSFFVQDIDGVQVTDYDYDSYNRAVAVARELSKQNPGTPYTIGVAIGSAVIVDGKVMDHDVYLKSHPEYESKQKTRVSGKSVSEQNGVKAEVVGGELEGVYDVEDLWKYADGKTPGNYSSHEELNNQPKLPGYIGPMWNRDSIRYESPEVYRRMST